MLGVLKMVCNMLILAHCPYRTHVMRVMCTINMS